MLRAGQLFLNHCDTLRYKSVTMVLILETCSLEEASAALGHNTKVLLELRDKFRDWLKLQPHLPQGMEKFGDTRLAFIKGHSIVLCHLPRRTIQLVRFDKFFSDSTRSRRSEKIFQTSNVKLV